MICPASATDDPNVPRRGHEDTLTKAFIVKVDDRRVSHSCITDVAAGAN